MGYSQADYTFREELSNNNGATLESTWAKKHGLIVALASNYDPSGVLPSITVNNVQHQVAAEHSSTPYYTYYYYPLHIYYYYYYYWYTVYYWYYLYYYYLPVHTKVMIIVPQENGTIRVSASGNYIFDFRIRVFEGNFTPDAGQTIENVSFVKSAQLPEKPDTTAMIGVKTNDLIFAIGTDASPNYALANLSYSGPAYQELVSYLAQYQNRSVRVGLWRVKNDGTVSITYQNCNAGRFLQKLYPSVEQKILAPPTISEPRAYFEIVAEKDAFERVKRPQWFESLYASLKHNRTIGLVKNWTRETIEMKRDDLGRPVDTRTRVIEMWAIPASYAGQVGTNALVFPDRATAFARIAMHDNNW